MVILGIDPGLAKLGWGVLETGSPPRNQILRMHDYGVLTTSASEPFDNRLLMITNTFSQLLSRFRPDAVAVEDIFFFKNVSSAIPVAKVIGALQITAINAGYPVRLFSPLQIKTALTGMGRAQKNQMQEMVRILLGLSSPPKPDHAADALAAAICYSNIADSEQRIGNHD